jgi:hypothetical protein
MVKIPVKSHNLISIWYNFLSRNDTCDLCRRFARTSEQGRDLCATLKFAFYAWQFQRTSPRLSSFLIRYIYRLLSLEFPFAHSGAEFRKMSNTRTLRLLLSA